MGKHNGIVTSEQYEKLKSYPTLPAIGQSDSTVFLAGNGAFLKPAQTAEVATASQKGLMSAADKSKLDGIENEAQVNSITGVKGDSESAYRTGNVNLTPANIGAATSNHNHDASYASISHSHSTVTSSASGFMSAADKQKLDGIAAGAQVNAVTGVKGNSETSYRTGSVNLTAANIGAAASNHGNHVPETQNANDAVFLRNDNTWRTVTPANIGAATSSHNHDSSYAAKSHTHSEYASSTHNHDSAYAAKSHNHDSSYAAKSHTHSEYASSTHTHSAATTVAGGFMSADDKKKLNGIAAGAQVNTVTGVKGNSETSYRTGNVNLTAANIGAAASSHGNHVPATQTVNNAVFLRNDNTWQTVTPANIGAAASSHSHAEATATTAGFLSAADKAKVDLINFGFDSYTFLSIHEVQNSQTNPNKIETLTPTNRTTFNERFLKFKDRYARMRVYRDDASPSAPYIKTPVAIRQDQSTTSSGTGSSFDTFYFAYYVKDGSGVYWEGWQQFAKLNRVEGGELVSGEYIVRWGGVYWYVPDLTVGGNVIPIIIHVAPMRFWKKVWDKLVV